MPVQMTACIGHVGNSATLGTSTSFVGNIIADQSVTMNTTATDGCGRVIALNAAVTMDTNVISSTCPIVNGGTTVGTFGGGPTTMTNTGSPATVSGRFRKAAARYCFWASCSHQSERSGLFVEELFEIVKENKPA